MRTRAGPSPLRLAIYVVVCVVLGVVTTVGVAWGCAAWVDAAGAASVFSSTRLTEEEEAAVVSRMPKRSGMQTATVTGLNLVVPNDPSVPAAAYRTQSTQRAFGHTRINRMTSNMRFDVQNGSVIIGGGAGGDALALSSFPLCEGIDRAGWPFRAFECSMPQASISTPNVSMTLSSGPPVIDGGIELSPGASGGWRALPYRPVWGGLIGNVLLLSVLWFGVLLMPGIARRRRRRKRGLCIACGYDLQGISSDRCPECWLPHGRGFTTEGHGEARREEEGETPKLGNAEMPRSGNAEGGSAGVPPAG